MSAIKSAGLLLSIDVMAGVADTQGVSKNKLDTCTCLQPKEGRSNLLCLSVDNNSNIDFYWEDKCYDFSFILIFHSWIDYYIAMKQCYKMW